MFGISVNILVFYRFSFFCLVFMISADVRKAKIQIFHRSKIIFRSLAPDYIQKCSTDFLNKISFSGFGCAMSSMQMLRAIMQSTFPFCPSFLLEMFPSHVSRHEFCTHCQRNTLSKSNKNDTFVRFMSFARASNDEFRVECFFF